MPRERRKAATPERRRPVHGRCRQQWKRVVSDSSARGMRTSFLGEDSSA
ncbi:hypothetical protein [Streptomyces cucumeris]